jgi:hypothetical protein
MGENQNRELLLYFKNRRAWRVNAGDPVARLEAYGMAVDSN